MGWRTQQTDPICGELAIAVIQRGKIMRLHRLIHTGWTASLIGAVLIAFGAGRLAPARAAPPIAFSVRTITVPNRSFSIALAPDGKTLALLDNYAIADPSDTRLPVAPIHFLDVASGRIVREVSEPADYANAAVFTPDGAQLIAYHINGEIIVWNVSTGKPIKRIRALSGPHSIALMPDGHTVAATYQSQILLWDTESSNMTAILGPTFETWAQAQSMIRQNPTALTEQAVLGVAVEPNGKGVFVSDFADRITLYNTATNAAIAVRMVAEPKPQLRIRRLKVTADGRYLAYFDPDDNGLHLWDTVKEGSAQVAPLGGPVFGLSPDGKVAIWVAGSGKDQILRMASLSQPDQVAEVVNIPEAAHSLLVDILFTPDGRTFIAGGFTDLNGDNPIYIVTLS